MHDIYKKKLQRTIVWCFCIANACLLTLCSMQTAGASLLVYQIFAYRWVNKILGPVNSTRVSSVSRRLLFAILICSVPIPCTLFGFDK
jgi:hypothetical protein